MTDDMSRSEDFEWAVKNDDLEKVKEVVEADKTKANVTFKKKRSPLMLAADYGHGEIIEYLLSKGSDINAVDEYGITPLLAAIYENHTLCVKLLLEKGADKTLKAPDGSSYHDCAESEDIKNMLK